MALSFITLDVFTKTRFRGNPLAIVQVPTGTALSQEQKQLIAREFYLSETVFLHEQTAADVRARTVAIDIFTPFAEVPFAGHPTVGTATYLTQHPRLDGSAKTLLTRAGPLPFAALGDGAQLAVAHDVHVHDRPFAGTAFGHFPVVSIVKGMTFIMARQPDVEAMGRPTESLLGTANTYTSYGVLDEGWRTGIVVSYFYVDLGLDGGGVRQLRTRNLGSREDPATGSAASGLCAFLSLVERDGARVQKYKVTQGVEIGRHSEIYVQVTLKSDRSGVQEVLLSGTAVKVIEGKIEIPQI